MSQLVRGNFDPTLIRASARQGDAGVVQMFGGGSATAGNALVFDANGNAVDGGSAPAGGNVTTSVTLTADLPVFGAGTDAIKVGTKSGNTDEVATVSGSLTSGHGVVSDASGNLVDSGAAPATGTVTHTGGALTADLPVFGAGSADLKVGTKSGNTDELVTQSGAATSGAPLLYDASGNAIAGSVQGNTTKVQMASGSAAAGHVLIYDANGNAVDGTISLTSQSANQVLAGPASGSAAAPAFRALVPADLPVATSSALGAVKPDGTIITDTSGAITVAQASSSAFGVVKVDGTTITASGGVISAVGGGVGGGAMTQIARQSLGTAAASVTFSSISASFNHLMLMVTCRSAATTGGAQADSINVALNGDTTAGHYNIAFNIFGTTSSAGAIASSQFLANIPNANAAANYPGTARVWIPDYINTAFLKNLLSEGAYPGNSASASAVSGQIVRVNWASAAAINAIVLTLASAANFVAGSIFTLYGLT